MGHAFRSTFAIWRMLGISHRRLQLPSAIRQPSNRHSQSLVLTALPRAAVSSFEVYSTSAHGRRASSLRHHVQGRRPTNLNLRRPSPIGIRRRKAAVQILIPESHEPLHSVSSANSDLTSPQLVLARFNPFPPFAAPIFQPLSFCSLLLPFALLLVCEACPVSVSVRPERLSVAGDSRDPGHHSRFVPFVFCLPPRHAALASMALPVGSRFIG